MKSNPDADPIARTIRSLVSAFRDKIAARWALPGAAEVLLLVARSLN
jgi:hypothetical protein